MTASGGREVDANLLRGAALGSAQTCANAQDARGQDLGDLVEALGGGHQVGVERFGHVRPSADAFSPEHIPTPGPKRRVKMLDLHFL
jgi:hypothetical protein